MVVYTPRTMHEIVELRNKLIFLLNFLVAPKLNEQYQLRSSRVKFCQIEREITQKVFSSTTIHVVDFISVF